MFTKKVDNKISMVEGGNDQKLASVTDSQMKSGLNDPPLLIQDDNLNPYVYNSHSSN